MTLALSQRELAREFKVAPSAIAQWEQGTSPVPGPVLRLIELYEEQMGEEANPGAESDFLRSLSSSWTERALVALGKNCRSASEQPLRSVIGNAIHSFVTREFPAERIKRNIKVAMLNRLIDGLEQTRGLPLKAVQILTYMNPGLVLTMDYAEGRTLAQFAREAPVEEREVAAEAIARYATVSIFGNFVLNTDPHPGNFVFGEKGRVALLDFGRVVRLDQRFMQASRSLMRAVIRRDREAARALVPAFPFVKDPDSFNFDEFWDFMLGQQLHLHSGKFRFTRKHIADTILAARGYRGQSSMKVTSEMIWSTAISFGNWSVFSDLDVEVDFGKVSWDALEAFG